MSESLKNVFYTALVADMFTFYGVVCRLAVGFAFHLNKFEFNHDKVRLL